MVRTSDWLVLLGGPYIIVLIYRLGGISYSSHEGYYVSFTSSKNVSDIMAAITLQDGNHMTVSNIPGVL